MSVTGEDAPVKVGVPIVDLFTGVYAAGAILAALVARDHGKGGQYIDMALFDVQTAMLANQACNYLVGGKVPGRMGNRHPNIVPYQDFPTADGRIAVAVGADRQFRAFAGVLGRPEWADDPRFARNAGRVQYREELCGEIASIMRNRSSEDWRKNLDAAGIPCGPIQGLDGVFSEQQALARGLTFNMEITGSGAATLVANPMRLSQTPPQYRSAPPRFAEHTSEVLQERLGLSQNEVFQMKQLGILA